MRPEVEKKLGCSETLKYLELFEFVEDVLKEGPLISRDLPENEGESVGFNTRVFFMD